MALKLRIISLEGIDWVKKHSIPEEDLTFEDFIKSGEIAVGDEVKVENKAECALPLNKDQYCVTFDKVCENGGTFFTEEPFSKDECKILFGNDFNY